VTIMDCIQCEHTPEEADDDVAFQELPDGEHWCTACRSIVDGWKQREQNAFIVMVNEELPDEKKKELAEHMDDLPDDFGIGVDSGTTNAVHGER